MPLKPKTRPVGQQVVAVNQLEFSDGLVIPIGTKLVIEGFAVGVDYKVSYKFKWGDKAGNPKIYWVKSTDIKKG